MGRCRHRNVLVREYTVVWHVRGGRDGELDGEGDNTEGGITGYSVTCSDCDARWGGPNANHQRRSTPRWVKGWIDKLHASDARESEPTES